MISFTVKGMSCGHCTQRITQAVKALDPKATLTIDLTKARVDIDSALAASNFEAAINAMDYLAIPFLIVTGCYATTLTRATK